MRGGALCAKRFRVDNSCGFDKGAFEALAGVSGG